jgi:hypothetical protein
MTIPEHDPEVRQQISRKVGDDVQFGSRGVGVAKSRFFVTKCRFTQRTATLRSKQWSRQLFPPAPESPMPRRHLTLVVVAIASLVVSACGSSPTAPRHDDPIAPPSIVTNGSY